ncbi:MAG TPA: hypothetical protein DHW82_01060, partial [Spirochaetia bacterium]|nr:hypothetical protein [Spirochaetia bacterium]
MKKKIYFSLVLSLFLVFGCEEKKENQFAEKLPYDSEIVLQIDSISQFITNTGLSEKEFFGKPLTDEIFTGLGFQFFKLSEWKDNGIDVENPAALIFQKIEIDKTSSESRLNIALAFPLTDKAKAVKKIVELFLKKYPELKPETTDAMTTLTVEKTKIYLTEKNGYLYVVFGINQDAKDFFVSLNDNKSLKDNPSYTKIASQINMNNGFSFYATISSILKTNQDLFDSSIFLELKKSLKEYEGIGFALELKNKDLTADSIFTLAENSKIMEIIKKDGISRKILLNVSENPLLFLVFGLNVKPYVDFAISFDEWTKKEYASFQEDFKKENGLDFEKDILEALDGNIVLGMFDGASVNMTNYNSLFTLGLKDETAFKKSFETLISKLPENSKNMIVKENDFYNVNIMGLLQLKIGFKDSHFIVATKNIFEKAIGSGSLLSKVNEKEVKKL